MRSALSLTTLLFCQLAMGQNIAIYPSPGTVEKGTTKQFSSYVAISPNTITWSVNGVTGGSATYGTVSQSGLYTAPAVTPQIT